MSWLAWTIIITIYLAINIFMFACIKMSSRENHIEQKRSEELKYTTKILELQKQVDSLTNENQ